MAKGEGGHLVEDEQQSYENSRFEDLRIWQNGITLTKEVYLKFKDNRDFGFRDQIQRACVSIPSNIAEGHERKGNKEFIKYLYIAKGSCGEVRTQLKIAIEIGYLKREEGKQLIAFAERLNRQIATFIKRRSSWL